MRKRSELIFSFLLVPVDVAALLGAFVAAYVIRVRIDHRPVAHPIGGLAFLKLAIIVMPVWILIFALSGLYGQSNLRGRLQEWGKILVGVSGGVMFMILLDFFSHQPIFPSRSVPIYAYGLGLILVTAGRAIVRSVQRWLFRYGIGVHYVLLVGSGEIAIRLRTDLESRLSGYQILGAVDVAQGAARALPGLPIYHTLEKALEGVGDYPLDGFIQADSALDGEEILAMVAYSSNHHLAYQFVPNQFGLYAVNATITSLAGIPMVELRLTPLEGWGRIVKRGFDLVGVTIGLVILSPVFALVAIGIKLTDPGPVLYRHRRLSRVGKEVYVYKFRSMYLKYSTGPAYSGKTAEQVLSEDFKSPELAHEFQKSQKLVDDPRVSRFGRWLRKTSLDELPQLLNVLAGDMSIVGPRPILAEELERYGSEAPTFLALKPGITGLWQISGRSDIGYEERVKLDIYYVEHWSLWLDTKILLKTTMAVLRGQGAQ